MNVLSKINYKAVIYILRLICKYYIAYRMFSYAFAKILKSQFDLGINFKVDYPVSGLNGFMFTWLYYGHSREYTLIIAGLQMLSGILILFKKTERLGIILFLSFMVNILLVNYFYEIDGAKSMSITLVAMGLFLLFSDWNALSKFLFTIKETIIDNPFKNLRLFNKIQWLNFLIIPLMIFLGYNRISNTKKNFLVKNELFGVWRSIDNDSNNTVFKLYFDYDNRFKLKDNNKNMYYGNIELDTINNKVKIKATHYSEESSYFVADSLERMEQKPKGDSLAELRKQITDFYNSKNSSKPINLEYEYHTNNDSLFLTKDSLKLKFLNISENYNL